MAALDSAVEMIEQALCECARAYVTPGSARILMAFDRERGQFLLLDEGWNGYRRIHHVWLHVELRDEKIYIHEDGTEEGIANAFLAAGFPHDRIVLAFQAPSLRSVGEFAAA